jgi:hypothetical protein
MPPKAIVPTRARPLRDSRSPSVSDQSEATPADAVENKPGSDSTVTGSTQVTTIQTSGVAPAAVPVITTTTTLVPPEPKGKSRAELSAAGLSEHLLRHTTSKKSKRSSKSSQASSKDSGSDVSKHMGRIFRKMEDMIEERMAEQEVRFRNKFREDTGSEVPLPRPFLRPIKIETPTPPPKQPKVLPSRHRFTTVDSEDEVDQNGDVNVRYDTVKFHGKTGNGSKDEVETFIANNELIFGLRPKQFKTATT